jgi:hypothetical protein
MKIISFVLILFCTIQALSQKGSIEGRIKYKPDSIFLEGVHVLIVGTNVGAVTNEDGYFNIDSLDAGHYDLSIHSLWFRTVEKESIEVLPNVATELNLALPEGNCDPNSEKICPIGNHSNRIIPILYGLPNQKGMKQAKKGKVHLAGCIAYECDPRWYCKKHNKSF